MGLAVSTAVLTSCNNQDISFSDFDYQSVYFANQYPARTVELGEDLFVDNSMDNEHKVVIKATMGGAYSNSKDIVINVEVDPNLCSNVYFDNIDVDVKPMPSDYYTLASNQIIIPAGSILGGVEVQLTEAFFADPLSLSNNYVIPLVMTGVQGADTILQGVPVVENPNRCTKSDWGTQPKDYVLYGVKYVNPWHGIYLRRGTDQITDNGGNVITNVRHEEYVKDNELVNINTNSLTQCTLPLAIKDGGGNTVDFDLVLSFSDGGTCTVSSNSSDFDISGTGKFVSKGEKNSLGGYDRDALYLDYTVDFINQNVAYATKDTLVVRDRGVAPEYFGVVIK